jgi:N utilization substance protein B
LYAAESQGRPVEAMTGGLARLTGPEPDLLEPAEQLAISVTAEQSSLDELLRAATEHWRLERLAVVDRIILRLAAYELKTDRVPPRVAIDEALWLAHHFGTPQSPAFVNGVLDRVARDLGRL